MSDFDINQTTDKKAWFCWDLLNYLFHHSITEKDFFHLWNKAKQGDCQFKSVCPRFRKKVAKYKNTPGQQLKLFY